jgi:GH25 family lysozyme M1 (1,4-beta-N-acetylmuramidase)
MTTLGIDTSNNNRHPIDWGRVRKSGRRFVYLKATEGTGFRDSFYADDRAAARAVGLAVGAYHFARPKVGDAIVQADFFLAHAKPRPGDLVPCLDLEHHDGLSPAQLGTWATNFMKRVQEQTDVKPVFYTYPGFMPRIGGAGRLEEYPLWVAHVGVDGAPRHARPLTGVWDDYAIHQFSWKGSIPGIRGDVDENRMVVPLRTLLIPKAVTPDEGDGNKPAPAGHKNRPEPIKQLGTWALKQRRRTKAVKIAVRLAARPELGHYSQTRPAPPYSFAREWWGDCSGSYVRILNGAGVSLPKSGLWSNTNTIIREFVKVTIPALGDAVMYRGHVAMILDFDDDKPTADLDEIAIYSFGSESGPYGNPIGELNADYRDDFVGFYRHPALA